ncbi:3-hydroxyacyl-CoA dehydrogenase [Elioraea thermophila]|uniref:3-hydroxyacyl-CoA dehydrogenase n=1 Tax=Elioraea thermophila TaxID=2185104 RepID=UPI001E5A6F45|nr:3-hydroxyacyl-CoA dehydrogenase [Elioraea thermophila]
MALTREPDRTVGVIGAGLIGRSWAVVFARAGWTVRLFDPDASQLARARASIEAWARELTAASLVPTPHAVTERIVPTETVPEAVSDAALVQECGPEDEEAKRAMFAELDRLSDARAVLASSTSSIVASRFTAELAGRSRCLVAHPVNPPHLVPVVELCPAPWTDAATIDRAEAIYREVGQVPVRVRKEYEGFVLNRLQGALLSEAFRLVAEGVISPLDLDATVCHGLGLRWSLLGPFATIALNAPGGTADYCARYGGFYRRLAADPPPPEVWQGEPLARVLAACGPVPDAAERERWERARDRWLIALKALKKSMPAPDGEER